MSAHQRAFSLPSLRRRGVHLVETAGKPDRIAQGSDATLRSTACPHSDGSVSSCCSDSDVSTASSDVDRASSNSQAKARSVAKRISTTSLVNPKPFDSDASVLTSNEDCAPSDSKAKTRAIVMRMRRAHHLRASESAPVAGFGSDDSMASSSSALDMSTTASSSDKNVRTRNILKRVSQVSTAAADMSMVTSEHHCMAIVAASDALTVATSGDKKVRIRNVLKRVSQVSTAVAAPCDAGTPTVSCDDCYKTWQRPKAEEAAKMQKHRRRLAKVDQWSKPQPDFSRERRTEALRALISQELANETL